VLRFDGAQTVPAPSVRLDRAKKIHKTIRRQFLGTYAKLLKASRGNLSGQSPIDIERFLSKNSL
jgi:hypothetical protein